MGLAHDYIQFQCLQIHFHNISSGLIISICKNELNLRRRSEPRSFARGHCSASHSAKSFAGTEDAPFEKTWISGPQEFLIFIKFIFFSALAVYGITCMSVLRVMTEFWKKKCSFVMALVLCGWMCLVPFNGLFVRILALLKTILTVSSENLHVNINTTNKTIWWRFCVTQYAIHLSILLLHWYYLRQDQLCCAVSLVIQWHTLRACCILGFWIGLRCAMMLLPSSWESSHCYLCVASWNVIY